MMVKRSRTNSSEITIASRRNGNSADVPDGSGLQAFLCRKRPSIRRGSKDSSIMRAKLLSIMEEETLLGEIGLTSLFKPKRKEWG
jgi:hypothetical protein